MRPKLKITSSTHSREDILDFIDDAHLNRNWTAKRRYQVILHAFSGLYATDEIADLVGCSRASVTNWVRRWREGGAYALEANHYKPTRTPALTEEMIIDLVEHLTFGLITGGKRNEATQVWLKERHDVDLSITAVDYWIDRLWNKVCTTGFELPKHPPENPHKVRLNDRRQKAEREKRRKRAA
jgi:transposase